MPKWHNWIGSCPSSVGMVVRNLLAAFFNKLEFFLVFSFVMTDRQTRKHKKKQTNKQTQHYTEGEGTTNLSHSAEWQ